MELPFPDLQGEQRATDTREHREAVARFIRETFGDPLPRKRAKYERQEETRLYYARLWKDLEEAPSIDPPKAAAPIKQPAKPKPKPQPQPKEVGMVI